MAGSTLLSLGGATNGIAATRMAPYLTDARQILPRFGDELEARMSELPLTVEGDAREDVVFAIPACTAGHPTLLAALPGALRLLRGVGFASFGPYVDEGFDGMTKAEDRLAAVLTDAERIAALLRRCRPAAEHNMRHAAQDLPALMQRRLGELTAALAWMARPDGD